jgi:hypothetical protein
MQDLHEFSSNPVNEAVAISPRRRIRRRFKHAPRPLGRFAARFVPVETRDDGLQVCIHFLRKPSLAMRIVGFSGMVATCANQLELLRHCALSELQLSSYQDRGMLNDLVMHMIDNSVILSFAEPYEESCVSGWCLFWPFRI